MDVQPPTSSPPWPAEQFNAALEQAKLEAMKELAYGASHEINNPLANIAARAQTLLRDESDEKRRRMIEAIHRQAMRAHEMIADLMLFARPPALERQPMRIHPLLEELADELAPLAGEHSVRIKVAATDEPLTVDGDRTQLGVALKALLENSIEAIGEGGEIAVAASIGGGGSVQIDVRDTGPGVPEEIRDRMFDPFFSGREAGRGLGFGLSKCWRIVTDHGGNVTVESPPAAGALFRIALPAIV